MEPAEAHGARYTVYRIPDVQTWLPWVIMIRFVMVTLILAIEYGRLQIAAGPGNLASIKHLGVVAVLWYIWGLFFLIYNQVGRDYLLQATCRSSRTLSSSRPSYTPPETWKATTSPCIWSALS